ncbi:MAG: leucine-rich repeat domain-containing protein [Aristaeellaceae bacterium]
MKPTKRILWMLLALALLLCATAALAEEPQWSYDSGNMYVMPEGELSGDVTVPAEVDGYAVNAIKYSAFNSNNEITSLTMSDTLRAIQGGAISWMDGLTSVTLNDGLEYIGSNFQDCNALSSLTIPASVRVVDGAIGSCASLKEITFEGPCPIFLNTDWCFSWLSDDYVIYVPDDQLDAYAAALAEVNGAAAHLQPSGKNAVIVETNNEDWFTFDPATGAITGYKEYHAWVEIPATIGGVAVKSIGAEAFVSDYSVYGVVFPEGLEIIEDGAFQSASNLAYVQFPSTLKTIANGAFYNAQIGLIDWSEGLEEIGAHAFQYGGQAILELPSTLRTIGESAFEGAWCRELYLGGNVESIGSRAFAGTSLGYMAFDLYHPIDIAPDAFADTYVNDLDLPWDSSMENRDAYAGLLAEQCPDCTVWINNPESAGVAEYPINETEITTIENGVWTAYNGDQQDLTVWTAYDDINVTALGDGLFKGNQSIRSFYPHHCGWFTTIGNEAFADSSVAYVELFGSITTIGDEAFRNCVNLTALTLPESLTSIGAGALEGCTGITELTLPNSLTTLGAGALEDCTGITELTLPASLTSIGSGLLEGCTNLNKLVVGCDPAILPSDVLDLLASIDEVYLSAEASDEQVRALSELMGRPWYDPLSREGEKSSFKVMPYEPLPGDDFWYDEEYSRLDAYQGYELNLILPREIDGVELSMIGGSMMTRATYGDNYDVELPVVSLVIPENYTEIPAYAFQNCDALETVICYAPLEKLEEGTFSGCTSLTNVIFVNGVREIDRYVFKDCLYLETVYIGDKTQRIDENAFKDPDGYEYFTAEQCVTDPALMPDVDALLEEVKCDPMPEPEEEPEYEPQPAQPVGEAGAPFLGEWTGARMEMEGMALSFSDMGMVMNLNFHEDGTVELYDGEESVTTSWSVVDGAAIVDGSSCILLDDGTLCVEEDGAKLIFTRDSAEAVPAITEPEVNEPAPVEPVSDELSAYVGSWHACYLLTGGMTGDPRSEFGLDIVLELNADGTGSLIFGEPEQGVWYQDENGCVYFGEGGDYDMPLTLLEGGFLCYGSMDGDGNALGGYIMFSQDPGAVWAAEIEAEPAATELPFVPTEPVAVPEGTDPERLERKYVCVSAEVSGYTMDASLLGGEYSLTFHADGTVDFVMVGTSVPGITWTQGTVLTDAGEAEAFIVDYYGNTLEAVCTEQGFDMNYFDSMLMHFEPEA